MINQQAWEPEPEGAAPEPEEEGSPQLDKEVFTDELAAAWDAQQKYFAGQLAKRDAAAAQQQQELAELRQLAAEVRQQRQEETYKEVDRGFAALADEFGDVLGKGARHEIGFGSPEMEARV